MKKRLVVFCAGVAAALLFTTAAAAIARAGVAQSLAERGVGAYYLDLLEKLDDLYGFSDAQYDVIQTEFEGVIALAQTKSPGLLSSPAGFSGCTEADYQTLKSHFSAICDAAGFTMTEARASQDDGRILTICNAADSRLLLEVKVADNELLPIQPGDLDQDGKVTVSDVVALRLAIVQGSAEDSVLAAGDMDGDGKLTVSDVVALRACIVNQ